MNTTHSSLIRKFILAVIACSAITVVGAGSGYAWDHDDHYYYSHHYYHHDRDFVWFHHHRGYWEHRDGVTFFVNID